MASETYVRGVGEWRSMSSGSLLHDDLGAPAEWPGPSNTGWEPTGVTLTPYTGTHFITVDTVIDSKQIDLEAIFVVGGAKLTITRSLLNVGFVDVTGEGTSLVMEDVTVNGGNVPNPIVGYSNLTLRRCDISGGQHSVMCSTNGLIEYCWLHDQFNDPDAADGYHNNGFISNGGSNVTVRYNTIDCSVPLTPNGGGPSGDASIFGDFAPVHDYTFKGNLFKQTTGGFGLRCGYDPAKPYGSETHHIIVVDNVWEKGATGHNGAFGPATSWNPAAPGNLWINNTYDDGSVVNPA